MKQLVILILCALPTPAIGAIEVAATDGRTWHDLDFDGDFNDGVGTATASSLVAQTDRGNSAARAAIEFNLVSLDSLTIQSAHLDLRFSIARDLQTRLPDDSDFGYPLLELYGYEGNGVVDAGDVLKTTSLITSFSPQPLSTVHLDVTAFLQQAIANDFAFAGFIIRVAGDRDPTQHSVAFFDSHNVAATGPRLVAEVVPEPASLVLWSLLIVAGAIFARKRSVQVGLATLRS